jgi:hypothetical protein
MLKGILSNCLDEIFTASYFAACKTQAACKETFGLFTGGMIRTESLLLI